MSTPTQPAAKTGSLPTIRRLPAYLQVLLEYQSTGMENISTTHIANALELDQVQVRKDLSVTGVTGRPRIGYSVQQLVESIQRYLGWNMTSDAVLVGVGHLGTALLGYRAFEKHGLRIVAAFDGDETIVGRSIHGIPVLPMSSFDATVRRLEVKIGILTVPSPAAHEVAQLLVSAGIKGIWNFTSVALQLPKGIAVQNEDLSTGLAVLCRKLMNL